MNVVSPGIFHLSSFRLHPYEERGQATLPDLHSWHLELLRCGLLAAVSYVELITKR